MCHPPGRQGRLPPPMPSAPRYVSSPCKGKETQGPTQDLCHTVPLPPFPSASHLPPPRQGTSTSPTQGISSTPRHSGPLTPPLRVTPTEQAPPLSPGPAPTQHQGDGVACEHPCQAGEVAVPVRAPRENLLVELVLGCGVRGTWTERHEDGGAGGSVWTSTALAPTGFLPQRGPRGPQRPPPPSAALTSLAGLRREKRRRGQRRCKCPEHQLRMLSHSTVRVGPGPSSRCNSTSCLRARTAVFSSICSSCSRTEGGSYSTSVISSPRPQ